MLYRKPRVSGEIASYCGKCKEERTHIISAMDGDIVRRVTCSMCGSIHNYRQKEREKAAAATSTANDGAGSTTKKRVTGTRRSKEPAYTIDPSRPVKSYDMNNYFAAGDVINHLKFGLGAVENVLPPNKIEVRFPEGKKLLLHNMKNFR